MNTVINNIHELAAICNDNKLVKKVVVVPNLKIAEDIKKQLILNDNNYINLEFKTTYDIAKESVLHLILKNDLKILSKTECSIIMENILNKLKSENRLGYFSDAFVNYAMGKLVYNLYEEVNLAGGIDISKEYSHLNITKLISLNEIFELFNKILEDNKYVDKIGIFKLTKSNGKLIHKTDIQFIHIGELNYSKLEKEVLALFTSEKLLITKNQEIDDILDKVFNADINFYCAKGEVNELKEILRIIKAEQIKLEDVSIYYTDSNVYPKLMYEICEEFNIPIALDCGVNIGITNEGKLIFHLLDWISSNYRINELIELITYVDISTFELNDINKEIKKDDVKKILRSLKFGEGRESYQKVIEKLIKDEEENDISDKLTKKIHKLELVKCWIESLLNRIPTTPCTFKEVVNNFIEIVNKYPIRSKSSGKKYIIETLKGFENIQGLYDIEYILEIIDSSLKSININSQGEVPGHIHMGSYKTSFWINRKFTFIVGLDDNKFPKGSKINSLLLDYERNELSKMGVELKNSEAYYQEELRSISNLIISREGKVFVSYSNFNTTENKEVGPCSLFIELIRRKKQDCKINYSNIYESIGEVKGFIPSDTNLCISKYEQWINLHLKNKHIKPNQVENLLPNTQYIIKSINARKEKGTLTEYEGKIKNGVIEIIDNEKIVLSPTMIEKFSKCPYEYFLKYVLGIKPLENTKISYDEWLSKLDFGNIVHKILEKYVISITNKSIIVDKEKRQYILNEIIDEQLREYKEKYIPISGILYEIEAKKVIKVSSKILSEDFDKVNTFVEYNFGNSKNTKKFKIDKSIIHMQGKADRVDNYPDDTYNIIDYKTGSNDSYTNDSLKRGTHIQLMIYAMLLEDELNNSGKIQELIYTFINCDENIKKRVIKYCDEKKKEVLEILRDIINLTQKGVFTRCITEKSLCNYCDYESICLYDKSYKVDLEKFNSINYQWNYNERLRFYDESKG